jgi:uncharacterized protein YdbL (DUF1318 family)
MKKKLLFVMLVGVVVSLGCARVKFEAPKDPIKVDISMRLDVYQHVEKDIDQIENIVSGKKEEKAVSKDKQSLLGLVSIAYAQDSGLSPEEEQAALRRKDRLAQLISFEQNGVIGEDKSGYVQIRSRATPDTAANDLVRKENEDRKIIYDALALRNGVSVDDIQRLYAKRLQANVASGTPIEEWNKQSGSFEWKSK